MFGTKEYGPTQQEIEARAYEIYLQRGKQDGRDLDDWLVAEEELQKEHREPSSMTARPNSQFARQRFS